MEKALFILSSALFIAEFGINYKIAKVQDEMGFNYNSNQIFNAGAWISGFVLSALALSFALDIKWYYIILINTLACWFLHPVFAFAFRTITLYGSLRRAKTLAMILGLVVLATALYLRFYGK